MSDSILESLAAQRRTAYLNQISNLELEFTRINEAFTGDDDLTAFVPVDTTRAGFMSWLTRVAQFPNEYRRAVQRVVTPVTRAEPQYSGDEDWSDAEREAAKPILERLHDLRQLLALKLALHGDAAIFPWIDEAGKLRLTPLLGFTFPVWDDMEVTKLEALLCFQRYQASSGVEFLVWEFAEGVMRRWENVRTLTAYNTQGTMLEELQPHAANRFPIAFHTLTRDPTGGVTGIGAQGLSAHRRYAQRAIQENASYERAGHPQRVAYDVEGDAVNSWKAYETIQISGNGRLEYLTAEGNLALLSDARASAATHLAAVMSAPNVSDGAGESGDARITSLEELVQTSHAIGNAVARIMTDATVLLTALGELPNALEYTLTPEFEAKRTSEVAAVQNLFTTGVISRYETIMLLQTRGVDISDDELQAALEERDALRVGKDAIAGDPGLGNASSQP